MTTARLLVNTANQLSVTFYVDGVATDPSPTATATVTVVTDAGTTIATAASTTRTGTGVFAYTLAARSTVDLITLTWTASFDSVSTSVVTYAETVGGFYAAVEEIRSGDSSLSSTVTYPASALEAARTEAEDEAERIMGRAFVSRYRRDKNLRVGEDGCVRTRMAHVTALRAISATWLGDSYTIATTDCRIVGDNVVYTGLPCGSLVSLGYEHGGLEQPPYEVVQKGILVRARQIAQRSTTTVNAYVDQVSLDNYGTIRPNKPSSTATGSSEADAVYAAYSLRYGIA